MAQAARRSRRQGRDTDRTRDRQDRARNTGTRRGRARGSAQAGRRYGAERRGARTDRSGRERSGRGAPPGPRVQRRFPSGAGGRTGGDGPRASESGGAPPRGRTRAGFVGNRRDGQGWTDHEGRCARPHRSIRGTVPGRRSGAVLAPRRRVPARTRAGRGGGTRCSTLPRHGFRQSRRTSASRCPGCAGESRNASCSRSTLPRS